MLDPALSAKAPCTAPSLLPVIDAAFARQGSPAQRHLETVVCPSCPVWRECLLDAAENGEHGPWGGTNARTRNRFVRRTNLYNMRDVEHPRAGHTGRPTEALALGAPSRTIKEWAVEQGLLPRIAKGRVHRDIALAYAAAQG